MSDDVKTDAVILAGGFGTRLRSVVSDVPKVLAPVNGRPFLDILIDRLRRNGRIPRVVLALGYMADRVIAHYRQQPPRGLDLQFFVEEQPLGTGGAARAAAALANSADVFVLNGDSYIEFDVDRMLTAHRDYGGQVTIALREVEDTSRFGRVEMDGEGRIERFVEKSRATGAGHINAGVYLFRRSILESFPDGVLSMEHDVFPALCEQRKLYGVVCAGKFIDIGVPESYAAATSFFSKDT